MNTTYLRGQLYYADLSKGVGSEQEGYRPVLIIQNDVGNKYSPTVIVAAVTSKVGVKPKLPTHCFIEANTVLVCRKLYAQEMKEECFLDLSLIDKNYPQKDYHTMYVAEIEHAYQK